MTEYDLLKLEQGYSETKIQHTCVMWFRATFPKADRLLLSFANGGRRDKKSASMRKYEGVIAGAPDLILIYPSGGRATLCIEMKVPKAKGVRSAGRLSDEQQAMRDQLVAHGSVYVVCHGLFEFITSVCTYLKLDAQPYIDKALMQYANYR